MQILECVRPGGLGELLDGYLKKLGQEMGLEIKLSDLKNFQLNDESPLILIVTSETLKEVFGLINKRKDKVIIGMNSRKDFKLVAEMKNHFSTIFGFIDLSQEVEYNIPVLKNYLALNFNKGILPLDKLASDLDKIFQHTTSELVRIKDLHDRFVRLREDKLNGVSLTSKFMAGEMSGGEFFEIIRNENEQEVIFIQAGSDSYVLSSMLMGEIEILKEKATNGSLQNLTEQFLKLLKYHTSEKKGEITYCLMSINLKNLHANFNIKGLGHLFYENEWISFDGPMQLKLKPSQRLCLISDGAFQNWTLLSKKPIEAFFKMNSSMTNKDLIKEFFFEVSRNKTGNFLIHDALMATVEVEEKKIYQV